jgi:predicted RNase H-like HicB family nuclease
MEYKYQIILYWSKEDEAVIAEVPELPGCMADGGDYKEALLNIELVIDQWIKTATELGRVIPAPKGKLMYA